MNRRRRERREAPSDLPEVLRRLGLTPRKALGQHVLVDDFLLADIAEACGLDGSSTVLEVGAGPGQLTQELAARAGRVVAVELDEELAALARGRLAGHEGVCVLAADILDYAPIELLEECGASAPYVAAGNLPYYITQLVIRRLLEADPPPVRIVVMVQREVARRMIGAGGRESMLSMSVKVYGRPELLFDVPSSAFWPPPKVQSAVVRIERYARPAVDLPPAELARFFNLLRAGYAEPRKQLHNALRRALGMPAEQLAAALAAAGIDPANRAQHLQIEDWALLFAEVERRAPEALHVDE